MALTAFGVQRHLLGMIKLQNRQKSSIGTHKNHKAQSMSLKVFTIHEQKPQRRNHA